MKNYLWVCNECGSDEYTSAVSESDINNLGCGNCGASEWHKEYFEEQKGEPSEIESLRSKVAELEDEVERMILLNDKADSRVEELEARLEIDPHTKFDGIAARDETIRLLEKKIAEYEKERK